MTSLIKKPIFLVCVAFIGYTAFLSWISFVKYDLFLYNGLDLAIYAQVFWNTAHGQWFQMSIHPGSYLGDHFELLIAPLSAVYALFQTPKTLLVLQSLALGVGVFPAYFLAKHCTEKYSAPRFVLPLSLFAYALNPFLWNMNLFEFHILPFAVPLLLSAILFYEKEQYIPYLLFLALLLLVREDVALVVCMFGVLAILQKRSWRWVLPPLTLGVVWFVFATRATAYFSPEGGYKFLYYYSWLGDGFLDMAKNAIAHPARVIAHLFSFGNIFMVLGLLVPFSFFPILRPRYLVLAVPVFLQIALGASGGGDLILKSHYSALFLPPLFVGFVTGLATAKEKLGALKDMIPIIAGVGILYGFCTLGPIGGIADVIRHSSRYKAITEAKMELVAQVPHDTSVIAGYDFLPHFASRQDVYGLNYAYIGKRQFSDQDFLLPNTIEYVIFDTRDFVTFDLQFPRSAWTAPWYAGGDEKWRAILEQGGFGVIARAGESVLLQREVGNRETLARKIITSSALLHDFGVLGISAYQWTEEGVEITWYAKEKMNINYSVAFLFRNASGYVLHETFLPITYGLYPTSEWSVGETLSATYTFTLPQSTKKHLQEESVMMHVQPVELRGGVEIDSLRSIHDVYDEKHYLGNPFAISGERMTR